MKRVVIKMSPQIAKLVRAIANDRGCTAISAAEYLIATGWARVQAVRKHEALRKVERRR